MAHIFRTGTVEDTGKLLRLGLNSFGQYEQVLTEFNWNKLHTNLSRETMYTDLLEKSTCFVCENQDEIIGMAFLISSGNPTDFFRKDWSYLRMVGVHTQHGGKKIGTKLTQICIDAAKANGEKTIALHTSEFMDAARHIYENFGFTRLKELEPMFGKKYWIYTLEL